MISSYEIVDFSIAAALEQHPDMALNAERADLLMKCCDAVDGILESGNYGLCGSVTENGDIVIELLDADSPECACSITINGVFLI